MAGLIGVTQGETSSLAAQFSAANAELEGARSAISNAVGANSEWAGPARQRFDAEWPQHEQMIRSLGQLLEATGNQVNSAAANIAAAGA